jgi:hypothetical protein
VHHKEDHPYFDVFFQHHRHFISSSGSVFIKSFFFPMTGGDQGRKPTVKQKQKQKQKHLTKPKGNAERKKREKDKKTSDSLLL